jgi:CBS domain-containing protein
MTQVGDVMIRDQAYCTTETRIAEIKYLMKKYDYEEILVVDTVIGKKPVGVISEADMEAEFIGISEIPSDVSAAECMRPVPAVINEESSLEECLTAMEESHMSHLPVIDGVGHYIGHITKRNIIIG